MTSDSVPMLIQKSEPLFPDILWQKPVSRNASKKILILGGNKNKFSYSTQLYQAFLRAGIGQARVLMPDSLQKLVGVNEDCFFAPSTPSGSLAIRGIDQIYSYINESDGLYIAEDLSSNSETLGLLKTILMSTRKPVILSGSTIDALDIKYTGDLLRQTSKLYIGTSNTIYKIGLDKSAKTLLNTHETLAKHAKETNSDFAIIEKDYIRIFSENRACQTKINNSFELTKINAYLATYWLQHTKSFEALCTATYVINTDITE